jgi:hypothetical protein
MLRPLVAFLVMAFTAAGAAAQETKATVGVQAEYLMTLEAPLEAAQVVGVRRIINVAAGGTVRGPRINGVIVAPAGDWLNTMPDGSFRLDVRLTIKTEDNELIFMEYGGVAAYSKDALERLVKGEELTYADDAYFVTAPRFTTSSTKYAWLNHIQAVGKMVSLQRGHGIKYDIFAMK